MDDIPTDPLTPHELRILACSSTGMLESRVGSRMQVLVLYHYQSLIFERPSIRLTCCGTESDACQGRGGCHSRFHPPEVGVHNMAPPGKGNLGLNLGLGALCPAVVVIDICALILGGSSCCIRGREGGGGGGGVRERKIAVSGQSFVPRSPKSSLGSPGR